MSFSHFLPFPWAWIPPFLFSQISQIFTNSRWTVFFFNFLVNWCVGNGNIFDDWYYHWYYHQLFLLHCHCFSIIITVYSKAWEKLVFLLALNISNIVIGLMEIIQLTCVASWLAGFCMVYTGFTWYISDE